MSNLKNFLFTSESVSEGHPDKVSDRISDMVVDTYLSADPYSRVACETLTTTNKVVLAGEVRGPQFKKDDLILKVRECIKDIGYDQDGFTWKEATKIESHLHSQSSDIAMGVDSIGNKDEGAGDQGLMFGFATKETDVLMPAPIQYAHRLMERQAAVRKKGILPWLRPDAKSQISFKYKEDKPISIDAVVLSSQHSADISDKELHEGIMEEIIKPVLDPTNWLTSDTVYHINPTGRFEIGGPMGDAGLTGRKIIVDTYGGSAKHGGGAFSGKDPSKVDRSAAYAGRYVAKNIVSAGIAERCEIQVSYAIGVAEPTSIMINTFGTGKIDDGKITELVLEHFDLRPYGILKMLDLLNSERIKYQKTAAYGHFGRENEGFSWELTDKSEALKLAAQIG